MVVLLAGGGTAGHINPALSIAGFIKERKPEAEIHFAGTPSGIENKLVAAAGYAMHHIEVYGFKRSLSTYNFKAASHLLSSVKEAKKLIGELKPDLCIGTGGYVSGPVVLAAAKAGVPTAIHEQNAYPGVTSRILAEYADRVMISFEDSRRYFRHRDKLILTGNPIRSEIGFADGAACRRKLGLDKRPVVLSFGGSLGARELNERIIDFIECHLKEGRIQHIHATGSYGWRWVPQKLADRGIDIGGQKDLRVSEYIYNMPEVMAAADIVISRAGAITLGELAVAGKPSILIPSPNVTNNHQYHNAMAYKKAGAAIVIEEKACTGKDLYRKVSHLASDHNELKRMGEAANELAIYDSTQKIYDAVFSLIRAR